MLTLVRLVCSVVLLQAALPLAAQVVQGTAFTYQGELRQNNVPVTASADMVFTLYDAVAAGNVIGAPIALTAQNGDPVQVVDGLFTVSLDFGAPAFLTMVDDARWLAVTVNGNSLSPRTKIENAPYALTSQLAYDVLAGSIGSTQINATQVQQRVSGSCASGSSISVIDQNGTVSCQAAGSGTITGVSSANGSGLSGGGTSGSVTLGTDLTVLQKRITGTCATGSAVSAVNGDGTVVCQSAGTAFTLPYSATQANAGPLFNIANTDTSSASTALQGTSNSTAANVSAVEGIISSTSPGLYSAGVRGVNNSTTGNGIGVYGTTAGSGAGVNGASASGPGVFGASTSSFGVQGNSASSYSGFFSSRSSSNMADTLHVDTTNTFATGIVSAAVNQGVLGTANNNSGLGVQGSAFHGVVGQAPVSAVGGFGVGGFSYETTTSNPSGNLNGNPAGVYGSAAAPSGIGVYGVATDTTGGGGVPPTSNYGIVGIADGPGGVGVYGSAANSIGVFAVGGIGLVANGTQNAAQFSGNVQINAYQPNSDIELTVESANLSNPNADIELLPARSSLTPFGFDISVGGASPSNLTFGIYQTPDGTSFNQFLGLDASGNLSIAGGTATKPGGGSWSAPSDARLKRDIQPLNHMLDRLLQLRGVTFEYKQPDNSLHPPGRHTGFIAQEVRQVFPDWVGQTPDGYLTVGPKGFEAMTVEALRELRSEKDAEIAELRTRLDALARQVNQLSQGLQP